METTIRIRRGDLEVECRSDDVFVATRLPDLVSELLRRMKDQAVPTPPPSDPQPSTQPRRVRIAGDVLDYFSGNPVSAARVTAVGLSPGLAGTSDAAGRYAFSGESAGSECFLSVTDVDGFADTTTGPFTVTTAPLTIAAFIAATVDVNRQYAIVGRSPSSGMAVVVAHLVDAAGGPLEEVPAADLSLIAGDGSPIGTGPFFFGPAGDIQPQDALTVSHAFNGRARAAFLNVPGGDCTLQLTAPQTGTRIQRVTVRVRVDGGASIVEVALIPN
jgi:hypothetical protein